ncbi:MAG: metallophosphoesterase [Rhodothermales bacterium]|nr:metallophosphoesterase [Rhodothermales bacterium]
MHALKVVGSVFLGLLVLALLWGVAIEPRFLLDREEYEAPIPALPAAWDGARVALLADFQVGMWWDNTGMVQKAIQDAADAGPALALIAGDFVYKPDSATIREAVGYVRALPAAGVPTVAVLGNHDYSLMKDESEVRSGLATFLTEELEAAGVTVLRNEATSFEREGAALWVAGVDSEWAEQARPGAALAGVPDGAPRVVFMHNPVAFRDLPADAAPLALAAHTHAGQVRLPGTPRNNWLDIARDREVVADGWAADTIGAAGNRLYVNRGIGFSIVPVRIFTRPELTLLTLRAAD